MPFYMYIIIALYYALFLFFALKFKNTKKLVFLSLVNLILAMFLMFFGLCFVYPANIFSYLVFPLTFFVFLLYNFLVSLTFEKLYDIKISHYNIILIATCALSIIITITSVL